MVRKKRVEKYRRTLIVHFTGQNEHILNKFKELTKLDDRIKRDDNVRETNGRMMYIVRKLVSIYNQQTLKYLQEKQKQKEALNATNQNPSQDENISSIKPPNSSYV
jgi:Fe-S cluster assembly iron-binding protein IscA